MDKFKILFLFLFLAGCNHNHDKAQQNNRIDIDKELTGIEDTRLKFMQAVKSNDNETIGKLITGDVETIGPGSDAWNDMYSNGTNKGPFPYDSIIMFPKETIIVSDSIAYDFGNSNVYYTNKEGEAIELRNTFLAIMKKGKDGIWRLHREVGSANYND